MSARRTCRACGCWELRACEGGCSWISADRCSACPDAPLTLPINAQHVMACRLHLGLDAAAPDFAVAQSVEYPQLVVTEAYRAGTDPERRLYVGALEVPWLDLDLAAELLNARTLAA
jgi:hypothetical protein